MEDEAMHEATVGHQGKLNFRVESTLSNPSLPIEVLIVTAELPGLLAAKRVWDFDGWFGPAVLL
ncbi:hypothetical protein ACIPWF_18410 [Paenarthrobacter sp. NPDC089989]|uniref:hypothetical protein n=2 Tax=Paenarthrobacter TaxID=1742992 RepID=UPI0037F70D28